MFSSEELHEISANLSSFARSLTLDFQLDTDTHISPHLQGGRINLIELIEVTVHNSILW